MIDRIKTNKAPSAIGAYSQGTIAGNLVFTSGQLAINPKSGELVSDNFESEILQVLKNVNAVLEAGGSSLENAIKLTVFIKDISKFQIINNVFSSYFSDNYPARSVVEISDLPLGVNIEIDAVGIIK